MLKIKQKISNWFGKNPNFNPYTISRIGIKRILTANSRVLPNYLILGAHKAGSSSLYLNLIKHPNVLPASTKEVNYFDAYYGSTGWYRANFPTKKEMEKITSKNQTCRIGESTPQYLFHPLVPQRVKALIPDAKFLVVLRNPIDRAFSHYNHNQRKKSIEPLCFEDALHERNQILSKAKKLALLGDIQASRYYETYSYLEKGMYVDQIERWFEYFPKENFFIFQTNEFNNITWNKIYEFLDLPKFENNNPWKGNYEIKYRYKPMKNTVRDELVELYKPYNEKLSKLLNKRLEWDK